MEHGAPLEREDVRSDQTEQRRIASTRLYRACGPFDMERVPASDEHIEAVSRLAKGNRSLLPPASRGPGERRNESADVRLGLRARDRKVSDGRGSGAGRARPLSECLADDDTYAVDAVELARHQVEEHAIFAIDRRKRESVRERLRERHGF